jgi:hypothetical protein
MGKKEKKSFHISTFDLKHKCQAWRVTKYLYEKKWILEFCYMSFAFKLAQDFGRCKKQHYWFKKYIYIPGMVAHVYNTSYLEPEIRGSRFETNPANKLAKPYLENKTAIPVTGSQR